MVTKNPCNHPGDIRRLKAICSTDERYDSFRHLFNVIVFPSKGYRPQQNKMSGGDLDGDVYMAIWDKSLVEKFEESPPSEYEKNTKKKSAKKNKAEVLYDFYAENKLGELSKIWEAFVDKHGPYGPKIEEAIKMSEYLCRLVDAAKHGEGITREEFIKCKKALESDG